MPVNNYRYKIVLVGDGGAGKTSYFKALKSALGEPGLNFDPRYIPTLGVDMSPLAINTNKGVIVLNFWDTAGQDRFGGMADTYYRHADGALVLFDVTSNLSYKNAKAWETNVKFAVDVPCVWVGAKCDMASRKINSNPKAYVDISSKNAAGLFDPLLELVRKIEKSRGIINDDEELTLQF